MYPCRRQWLFLDKRQPGGERMNAQHLFLILCQAHGLKAMKWHVMDPTELQSNLIQAIALML